MDKKISELEIKEQGYTNFLMKEKQLIKKEISELIYLKNKKYGRN